jgi:hypothetical protein
MGVVAALLEGLEIVAVAGCHRLHAKQRQALAARAQARGAVLLAMDAWPGADLHIQARPDTADGIGGWTGTGNDGHGRLRQRRVRIRVAGHGLPHSGRVATVLLPGPRGELTGVSSGQGASESHETLFGRRVS